MQIRTIAMPADANPNGDICGGWVLSQMAFAGGLAAARRARGRVVTVGIEAMTFVRPVAVGDVLCCYGDVVRVGTSSLAVAIAAWKIRWFDRREERMLVTEGQIGGASCRARVCQSV